ncbi:hypothetical protein FFF34_000645 [Inquilinus sp. KBS0705]|nr:hypothetical protein FFF34_000645 [Inquilinus sp. KBS0705]
MSFRKLILLVLVVFPCVVFSQNKHVVKPHVITRKEEQLGNKYSECLQTNRYSVVQRRQFFPFKTADTIRLVSYEAMQPNYNFEPVKNPMDTVEIFIPMAVNYFKLNAHRIIENKVLNVTDIDSLTDLMYNIVFYRKKPITILISALHVIILRTLYYSSIVKG